MEECLADMLVTAAGVMHWFGQYRLSNTMILTSRFFRARNINRLEELEEFVIKEEKVAAGQKEKPV